MKPVQAALNVALVLIVIYSRTTSSGVSFGRIFLLLGYMFLPTGSRCKCGLVDTLNCVFFGSLSDVFKQRVFLKDEQAAYLTSVFDLRKLQLIMIFSVRCFVAQPISLAWYSFVPLGHALFLVRGNFRDTWFYSHHYVWILLLVCVDATSSFSHASLNFTLLAVAWIASRFVLPGLDVLSSPCISLYAYGLLTSGAGVSILAWKETCALLVATLLYVPALYYLHVHRTSIARYT
jgi:hypothetical protein